MAGFVDIAGATQVNAAGSFAVSPPPGLAAGDIWVILLAGDGSLGNLGAAPTGFVSLTGQQSITADNQCWDVYAKTAGASESAATVLANFNGVAVSIRVTGVTGIDAVSSVTTVNAASTTVSLAGSSLTTTGDSRTLLWLGIADQTASGAYTFTWAGPAGFGTARGFSDSAWTAVGIASGVAVPAGAYGTTGASIVSNGTTGGAGVMLAFADTAAALQSHAGLVSVGGALFELPAGDTYASPVNGNHAAYSGLDVNTHSQYFDNDGGDIRWAAIAHTQTVDTLDQSGATASASLAVWDGAQWSPQTQPGLTRMTISQAANRFSTSTTLATAGRLALPMIANGVYQVEADLTFMSQATTTGVNVGIAAPAGARCMVEITVPITSTAASSQLRTTFPNAATAANVANALGTGVSAANSNHTARIVGIVRNGATAGFCEVQFATEVAASTVTLQPGSTLSLTRIA